MRFISCVRLFPISKTNKNSKQKLQIFKKPSKNDKTIQKNPLNTTKKPSKQKNLKTKQKNLKTKQKNLKTKQKKVRLQSSQQFKFQIRFYY